MKIIHKTFGGPSDESTIDRNIQKAQHPQSVKWVQSLCWIESFVVSGKFSTDFKSDVVSSCMFR